MKPMIPRDLSSKLVAAINRAEEGIYKDIETKSIAGEENITSALLKEIRSSCSRVIENELEAYGPYEIWTKEFPKNSMEPEVGADFAITIRKFDRKGGVINQTGVKTALVQAKLPTNKDYEKLKKQIGDMFDFAGDESYIAVYEEKNVYVSSIKDVLEVGCKVTDIPHDKRQSLGNFFKDIFDCIKGKRGFDSKDIRRLNELFYSVPSIGSGRSVEFSVMENKDFK